MAKMKWSCINITLNRHVVRCNGRSSGKTQEFKEWEDYLENVYNTHYTNSRNELNSIQVMACEAINKNKTNLVIFSDTNGDKINITKFMYELVTAECVEEIEDTDEEKSANLIDYMRQFTRK